MPNINNIEWNKPKREDIIWDSEKEPTSYWGRVASALPESLLEYGKAITSPIHSPIQTFKGIGQLGEEAQPIYHMFMSILRGEEPKEFFPGFRGMIENYVTRYGGLEKIKETFAKDPMGTFADFLTPFVAGGGIVPKVGKIAGAMEPVTALTKGLGIAAEKIIKPLAKGTLGFTTRVGPESIERAMRGTEEFKAARKGIITEREIVKTAQSGLQDIKDQMYTDYRSKLAVIKTSTAQMDLPGLKDYMNKLLADDYGVTITPQGKYDFSRSTFGIKARKEVAQLTKSINSRGTLPEDITVMGFDQLRREVDDFYAPTKNSRAFVESLRAKINKEITSKVPEYKEMIKPFHETKELIEEIESGLSLKKKTAIDTSMKKLVTKMKSDSQFSKNLIEVIEERSGKNIGDLIAGYQMREWFPKTLPGAVMLGGTGLLAYLIKPSFALIAASTSPRMVGEFMSTLNSMARTIGKIPTAPMALGTFQLGREEISGNPMDEAMKYLQERGWQ